MQRRGGRAAPPSDRGAPVLVFNLLFDTGARRSPGGWIGHVVKAFAAATAVWTVYAAGFSRADRLALTITFLSLMLVLSFVTIGATPDADRSKVPAYDWA